MDRLDPIILKLIETDKGEIDEEFWAKISCYNILVQVRNFKNWTSGNNDIDKFIQDTQLSVHKEIEISQALEWIPYDRLHDIKYIAKSEFVKVYRANWIDGEINYWYNGNWERHNQNMFVILKSLNNLINITTEIENEV
ncbi:hypothetical protein C1646_756380 [Rhizophagus diaphanus]|nr:hypothetical protein C1646_756380 [Rhizophagus diaphanus] [Rhizophagus sp. MUCL 43196]